MTNSKNVRGSACAIVDMRALRGRLYEHTSKFAERQCTQLSWLLRRIRKLSRAAQATAPRLSRPVPQYPWALRVHQPGGPIMPLAFALCCRLVWSRGCFVRHCADGLLHGVGFSKHGRQVHNTARMTSCRWHRPPLRVVDLGVHIGVQTHRVFKNSAPLALGLGFQVPLKCP